MMIISEKTAYRRRPVRATRLSALAGGLTLMLAAACGDFHMSASELMITPNPAVPGDVVSATFVLSLIPAQNHTIIVVIDGAEHVRVNATGAPSIPETVLLGDATNLIATYGAGDHQAHVVVHAGDEVTRTQAITFRLNDSASQE